jgi:16S rRNA G966 N2-methylase RsmD
MLYFAHKTEGKMPNYGDIQKEETLKARVFADFFGEAHYKYEPNIDNIDFVATDIKTLAGALFALHLLWAEAKRGAADARDMFTQLLLTCKKTIDRGLHLPPPYLACFDSQKIAFIPFYDILPIFVESDVNWNATPSNYDSPDFQKLRGKVEKLILSRLEIFYFETDADEIKAFIKKNLRAGAGGGKIRINKNNFIHIYYRWVKEVKPFINLSDSHWAEYKKQDIFDCDFFRADMMSEEVFALESGNGKQYPRFSSISERLQIILRNDKYDLPKLINNLPYHTEIDFNDGGEAYRRFWAKYERPPAEEYRQDILERRFLLVDQNIREIRGEFFTPAEWVELSQEYLARVFGEDWQKEYYVWDCCAGSGNLLVGLQERDRIWASDISEANVKTMRQLAADRRTLRESHIFQFDFLNDYIELPRKATKETMEKAAADVKKLEACGLKEILDDPEKRKKLIIYINPPYAEAATATTVTGTGKNKINVSNLFSIHEKYSDALGKSMRELFVQFFIRIYFEISGCKLAAFSKLKYITAPNFKNFRKCFRAEYKNGFIVPAYTFDNVKGKFPIGFLMWDSEHKEDIKETNVDIYDEKKSFIGKKTFASSDDSKTINMWLKRYVRRGKELSAMCSKGTDFQNSIYVNINFNSQLKGIGDAKGITRFIITDKNLIPACVYLAVRKVIKPTWLNDRDQFLYPNDGWEKDAEFQHNCLVYALFNNNISCKYGVNHWIPFTEEELGVEGEFKSRFMSDFFKNLKSQPIGAEEEIGENPFSVEAQAVLNAGLALFRYYHEKARENRKAPLDASFYDIREFFQGRNENGKMNVKSADDTYAALLAELRAAQKTLAQKIAPNIYEYGFLRG